MEKYSTATLSNGLRVIYEPQDSGVTYCGYVMQAGTRNELPQESGMAHFIEHMSFKGTQRRNSWHINNAIECVGGDLNAYTGKEETVFYAALPSGELPRAIDVLSDMVFNSTYPQREIDKEVEVIIDEIQSFKDSPADLIFDDFEGILFNGHPLGRDILGKADVLRKYTTADAASFTSRMYSTRNATFYIYGKCNFDKMLKLLEKSTSDARSHSVGTSRATLPAYKGSTVTRSKHSHQAHVIIGTRGYGGNDSKRTTLFLLNNILGGPAMNSRFNIVLREHSGLVYTVESFTSSYIDTGVWGVYFGCDESKTERCCKLILRELDKMASEPLSPARLAAAKRMIKGQMLLSRNNYENYSIGMGRTFAKYGRHRDIGEICQRIDAVSSSNIQQVAADLFAPESLTTLIYVK